MRARTIAVLGIAAYLVFAAATIPARFVTQRLAVPGTLEFSAAQGTLWNGSARANLGAALPIETLRWRFLPSRLVFGRLAFAVDASGRGIEAHGRIERGLGDLEARDLRARADAAALAPAVPLAAAWQPQGALTATAPAVAWDGRGLRGSAQLEWRDAALAASDVRPLGSYRIEARAEGGPARITLATLDGPLRLAGTGSFAPPASLAFSGEARAQDTSANALEPLLNLLGPRRADGARALEWRYGPAAAASRP